MPSGPTCASSASSSTPSSSRYRPPSDAASHIVSRRAPRRAAHQPRAVRPAGPRRLDRRGAGGEARQPGRLPQHPRARLRRRGPGGRRGTSWRTAWVTCWSSRRWCGGSWAKHSSRRGRACCDPLRWQPARRPHCGSERRVELVQFGGPCVVSRIIPAGAAWQARPREWQASVPASHRQTATSHEPRDWQARRATPPVSRGRRARPPPGRRP